MVTWSEITEVYTIFSHEGTYGLKNHGGKEAG